MKTIILVEWVIDRALIPGDHFKKMSNIMSKLDLGITRISAKQTVPFGCLEKDGSVTISELATVRENLLAQAPEWILDVKLIVE